MTTNLERMLSELRDAEGAAQCLECPYSHIGEKLKNEWSKGKMHPCHKNESVDCGGRKKYEARNAIPKLLDIIALQAKALERLSTHEAFYCATASIPEEVKMRIEFARAAQEEAERLARKA